MVDLRICILAETDATINSENKTKVGKIFKQSTIHTCDHFRHFKAMMWHNEAHLEIESYSLYKRPVGYYSSTSERGNNGWPTGRQCSYAQI